MSENKYIHMNPSEAADALEARDMRIAELEAKYSRLHDAYEASEQDLTTLITELRDLKRYNNVNESYYMEDNELGLWLRYADVMRIINDHM